MSNIYLRKKALTQQQPDKSGYNKKDSNSRITEEEIVEYYSREDIIREIYRASMEKEVVGRFLNGKYATRPSTLQFPHDVSELAKIGISSFHISVERWKNPLSLRTGMSKEELNNLRCGWDFIFDLDAVEFELSKIVAVEIINYLSRAFFVENISVKFSGNKGWHIALPFESFGTADTYIDKPLPALFPEICHKMAKYLMTFTEERLRDKFSDILTLKEYKELTGDTTAEINPWRLVEVDTLVMSTRHLYRAPYSLNEKSGLVSLPVNPEEKAIKNFKKKDALPDRVKVGYHYLEIKTKMDAQDFMLSALTYSGRKISIENRKREKIKKSEVKTVKLSTIDGKKYFPPCIINIEKGIEDGRKRAEFILRNFLSCIGWDWDRIERFLVIWNKNNPHPLPDNYIKSHISWHKKQKRKILPPGCNNQSYYASIGVCEPDSICKNIKNPVMYPKIKARMEKKEEKDDKTSNLRDVKGTTKKRKGKNRNTPVS